MHGYGRRNRMKIVIDIDEDYYEIIKHDVKVNHNDFKPYTIIANGTLLPKGHGRLIDADELKKHKYHDSNRFENAVAVAYIDWADTIIEADKGETEWNIQKTEILQVFFTN